MNVGNGYFGAHNHTDRSNVRLLDSINKPSDLIDIAIKKGLCGIAITDHEILSAHLKALEYVESLKKNDKNKDNEQVQNFRLALGNEIYLCRNGLTQDNYDGKVDKYFHFILIAKDKIGYNQLKRLSARAWKRSWIKFLRRTPTYYSDVEEVIGEDKGHLIAATACLGGFLGTHILRYGGNSSQKGEEREKIYDFLDWCNTIFLPENFYLELQPSKSEEQIYVNNEIIDISKKYNNKIIITTDAHYLTKEDRENHKIFLTSSPGEREVDEFYASTYVMSSNEVHEYMDKYIGQDNVEEFLKNTREIYDKCEEYELAAPFKVPYMPLDAVELRQFTDEERQVLSSWNMPMLEKFSKMEYPEDVHLAKRIYLKGPFDEREKTRLNDELIAVEKSSDVQNIRWSRYLLQVSDYVKIFWELGDTLVGPGRGSAVSFYINYLLDITQINPLKEDVAMFYWRFLNPERASILDIDCDVEGAKRDKCIEALQKVYGKNRVVRVSTEGTVQAKNAILSCARGLGIDVDVAQYLSSMIESERGIQHTLRQTFYGDEDKGISANKRFADEMTMHYPELWKAAQRIEGLISHSGVHAGGVIIVDEDFLSTNCIMTTTKGDLISQFDLHDSEKLSNVKIDLLAIEALDKIRACLDLLIKYGYVKKQKTLKETYEQIIGIYNIERDDPKMWEMVWSNQIISLFQMEQQSGIQGIALIKPKSVYELAVLNSVIRLMAPEKGAEQPLEMWARYRQDITQWYQEMADFGLTKEEIDWLAHHKAITDGICESQEGLMSLVQEPRLGQHSLAYSDRVRKGIAKFLAA